MTRRLFIFLKRNLARLIKKESESKTIWVLFVGWK